MEQLGPSREKILIITSFFVSELLSSCLNNAKSVKKIDFNLIFINNIPRSQFDVFLMVQEGSSREKKINPQFTYLEYIEFGTV